MTVAILREGEVVVTECIYVDFNEMTECHSEKLVWARKPYRCDECSETISSGSLYETASMKCDECWSRYRTCARCVNVRTDYFRTWIYTQIVEDFKETHGFDYRKGIPADFAPCKSTKETP